MISDRKDYYHQIWVTSARSPTNAVGPAIYLEMLKDAFIIDSAMKRRACREVRGGGLHNFALHPGECLDAEVLLKDVVGLVLGLYFRVTAAREQWLQQYQLLDEQSRLIASRCLRSPCLLQGLVIDIFFAASVEGKYTANEESQAAWCYKKSQEAYGSAGLLGSPEKDVTGKSRGKLVGAYVNSGPEALSPRGLCTIVAPPT